MPLVAPPGPQTGQTQSYSAIAVANIRDTAKVNYYLSIPIVRNKFPQDLKFLWGKPAVDENGKVLHPTRTLCDQDNPRNR